MTVPSEPEVAPRNNAGSMTPPRLLLLLAAPRPPDFLPDKMDDPRSEDGYHVDDDDAAVAPLTPLHMDESISEAPEMEGAPPPRG